MRPETEEEPTKKDARHNDWERLRRLFAELGVLPVRVPTHLGAPPGPRRGGGVAPAAPEAAAGRAPGAGVLAHRRRDV